MVAGRTQTGSGRGIPPSRHPDSHSVSDGYGVGLYSVRCPLYTVHQAGCQLPQVVILRGDVNLDMGLGRSGLVNSPSSMSGSRRQIHMADDRLWMRASGNSGNETVVALLIGAEEADPGRRIQMSSEAKAQPVSSRG